MRGQILKIAEVAINIGSVPIALQQPNGGEVWYYGNSETISWYTGMLSGSTVDIYILHNDPSDLADYASSYNMIMENKNWYKFGEKINNTGNYTIDPESLNGIGNAYVILIVSDTGEWDISNSTFRLAN